MNHRLDHRLRRAVGIILLAFPFLIPFGIPARDIDIKAWLLWCLGLVAYLILLRSPRYLSYIWQQHRVVAYQLIAITASLLLATALAIAPANALFGSPAYRGGMLSELSCIAIALVMAPLIGAKALRAYWWSSALLAIASIGLDYPYLVNGARLIGPVYQSNVLAVLLAAGVVVGAGSFAPRHQTLRWLGQSVLLLGLVLTQSRGLLALAIVISGLVILHRNRWHLPRPRLVVASVAAFGLCLIIGLTLTGSIARLSDATNLRESIAYRYQLQEQGVRLLTLARPVGWGPDSIGYIYDRYFPLPPLIATTYETEHVVVDSTHNIYLDHLLEWGWLGGLAFIALSASALRAGSRMRADPIGLTLFALTSLLVLQSLINVTMLEQEVVFWVVIIAVALRQRQEVNDVT